MLTDSIRGNTNRLILESKLYSSKWPQTPCMNFTTEEGDRKAHTVELKGIETLE